ERPPPAPMSVGETRRDSTPDFAWSPDSRTIAIEEPERVIGLWDVASGTRLRSLQSPGDVFQIVFRSDGSAVCAVTGLGAVVWDASTGKQLFSHRCADARWSPSGALVVVRDDDGAIRLLDGRTQAERWHASAEGALDWSSGSDIVVVTSPDRIVFL